MKLKDRLKELEKRARRMSEKRKKVYLLSYCCPLSVATIVLAAICTHYKNLDMIPPFWVLAYGLLIIILATLLIPFSDMLNGNDGENKGEKK